MQNISKGYIHFNGDKLKDVLGLPKEVLLSDVKIGREGVTLAVLSAENVTVGEQQVTHNANSVHENITHVNGFNLEEEAKSHQLQAPSLCKEGGFKLLTIVEKGLMTAEEAHKSTIEELDYLLSLIAKSIKGAARKGNYDTEVVVEESKLEVIEKELNAKGYVIGFKKDFGGSKLIQVKW